MEFTHQRTVTVIAVLLIIAAINQSVYTALYIAQIDVPRQLLWGGEGLLFSILAVFAGSAMVRSKTLTLAFSAIAFSAALNVVQVGVGLTLFGPFGEAAGEAPALAPAAGAIVAYSFFVYNAAKIMLGLAALVAGLTRRCSRQQAVGRSDGCGGGDRDDRQHAIDGSRARCAGRDPAGRRIGRAGDTAAGAVLAGGGEGRLIQSQAPPRLSTPPPKPPNPSAIPGEPLG